jgi:hypothetical protein
MIKEKQIEPKGLEKMYVIGSWFVCHTNPQEHLGFGKWEEYARIPPQEVTFAEGYEDMLSEENKNAIIEEFKKGQIYWVRVE